MKENTSEPIDISLLVCTYNRSADLRELLQTAVVQETDGEFTYEILVIDNNSTDDTRQVVESFIREGHKGLSYIFEEKQGKSHALNTGLNAVRGAYYAIVDDDFILPPDWVRGIMQGFRSHPGASFVSGKVLPLWEGGTPPGWLTEGHWSAIAMADYGDNEFVADHERQVCLLACSFRVEDVRQVGGYHSDLGPKEGRTGATEDLDLLKKLWRAGMHGVYVPNVEFLHKVSIDRASKAYHRKWHGDHGRSYAVMRAEEVERSSGRLFDVPIHLYRQAMMNCIRWLGQVLQGRHDRAFKHETELRFFVGFVRQRYRDFRATATHGNVKEVASFLSSIARTSKNRVPHPYPRWHSLSLLNSCAARLKS